MPSASVFLVAENSFSTTDMSLYLSSSWSSRRQSSNPCSVIEYLLQIFRYFGDGETIVNSYSIKL